MVVGFSPCGSFEATPLYSLEKKVSRRSYRVRTRVYSLRKKSEWRAKEQNSEDAKPSANLRGSFLGHPGALHFLCVLKNRLFPQAVYSCRKRQDKLGFSPCGFAVTIFPPTRSAGPQTKAKISQAPTSNPAAKR
jgi:hypothetical protein